MMPRRIVVFPASIAVSKIGVGQTVLLDDLIIEGVSEARVAGRGLPLDLAGAVFGQIGGASLALAGC
jgi:hypothetical protein